jgi:hypothetical protein
LAYKVIHSFTDKQDDNRRYEVGEEFPKGNSKPTKKRLEELSSPHPTYKRAFIEEVEEKKTSSRSNKNKE